MASLRYFLLLLLAGVRTEEVATPSSLLGPRNFNHHAFDVKQFLKEIEPTKQGPVVFPNDAPPPPRPPLIVTSRPLIESIARSELNPNNSVAEQSQINRVTFKPDYLARVKSYQPFAYPVPVSTVAPYDFSDGHVPYADVAKKRTAYGIDNRYNDYEEQTALPPIYKALENHANEKVLKQPKNYDYQSKDYLNHQKNDANPDGNSDYNYGQNYAFSYAVKDRKTGDDFSHSQQSSGSATNGEYRVRLPDGRMQIVSYTADENGYKADVRYDGQDKTSDNSIDNHNGYNNNHRGPEYSQNRPRYSHNGPDYNHNNNDYNNLRNNYNDRPTDYSQRDSTNYKVKDDYYQYPDASKEYYNDDYTDYGKTEPHKSKFNSFNNQNTNQNLAVPNHSDNYGTKSTVTPSYETLKELFITQNPNLANQNYLYSNIPVEINVPSTTPNPNFDGTTEHVVVIGAKSNLYTDIRNSVPGTVTPVSVTYSTPNYLVSSTPSSYLLPTISSLINNVNLSGPKPILSDSYINRINKYIKF